MISLICDITIIENSDDVLGVNFVYCEEDCKGWLHCKYVCMSKQFYNKISKCNDPYYCPNCIIAKQSEEVLLLRNQIRPLSYNG